MEIWQLNKQESPTKITAKVISVDESKMTATCKPDEGADMKGVLLTARQHENDFVGSVNVPKVGSMVVIDAVPHGFAVVETEELAKIIIKGKSFNWVFDIENGGVVMNDGQNGEIIITSKLVQNLQEMNATVKMLQNIFAAWVPVPSDGGAALKAAIIPFTTVQLPDYQGITNKNFKH